MGLVFTLVGLFLLVFWCFDGDKEGVEVALFVVWIGLIIHIISTFFFLSS